MAKRPMCLFFFAFLAGVIAAYLRKYYLYAVFFFFLLYLFADMIYALIRRKKPPGRREKYLTALMIFLTILAGMTGWLETKSFCRNADWYETADLDGKSAEISGSIYAKERTQNSYMVYLKDVLISCEGNAYKGNCIILRSYLNDSDSESETPIIQSYKIGQKIYASGKISYFDTARNPGNFDMRSYYRMKGIDMSLNLKESGLIDKKYKWYTEFFYSLKLKIRTVYINTLSEEEYGVLSTMALGDDSLLNDEIESLYQKAGISHILAISGLHISIVGMMLYRFLRKKGISYFLSGGVSFSLVFSYALMSGMALSAQRALVMFSVLLLGNCLGEAYDSLSALSFAGIFLLLQNPLQLFTASFQLSFSAVAGAVLVAPLLKEFLSNREKEKEEKEEKKEGIFSFIKKRMGDIFDSFTLSLGIQLLTIPITLYYFFELPVYSILINLLILPLVSCLLLAGLVGGFVGLFSLKLASVILLPDRVILQFYAMVCRFFQKLPCSSLILGRPALWKFLLYYSLLLFFLLLMQRTKKKEVDIKLNKWKEMDGIERATKIKKVNIIYRLTRIGSLALFLFLSLAILKIRFLAPLEICMIDVGQGDGICIRKENGTSCFVDGGSTDIKNAGKYRVLPYLKSQRIGKIDWWFVSHTDADHISALEEALEADYQIEHLVLAKGCLEDDILTELLSLAEGKTEIYCMGKGESLSEGEFEISCIYPPDENSFTDKNDASMVLKLKYGEFDMLFTGDISSITEKEMLEKKVLEKVEVLKVPHHGSKSSSSAEFLEKVGAKTALISAGVDNSYGHPTQETLERLENAGSKVYRTDQDGAIRIYVYEEGYAVREFLSKSDAK
jgi:competence protein ComEC